ncbi:hypothetical protein VPH35_009705 [Triticum aestivum]|uniref:Uncharacterized protein n=1 Tax=Triticum turgidum subsp. durum TaxID=4567 RepID=A0A9R0R0D8_TRITD|nr:unnamed protein product [Triticum turgidum subsp. durum]
MAKRHKNNATKAASRVDNGKPTTVIKIDPWNPPYPMHWDGRCTPEEFVRRRTSFLITSRASNTIVPDRTPPEANSQFYHGVYPRLLPVLEKDSVRRFLRLFAECRDDCMTYGSIIIPEAFNHMVVEDALRCAKVAMEGKAPELEGHRANPNYMNQYGYFPLHEAAERFSVEMIRLLLRHGDNLLLPKEDSNYPPPTDADVYRIIHLLCLPEMKIFLDTTRLLAAHTDNLVDEVCNYINDGKLLQTAVLLLAAQAHIRVGCRCNGKSVAYGFTIITAHIGQHIIDTKLEMLRSREQLLDLEAKCQYLSSTLLLVRIISQAGKALDSYIRTHQEVPQTKVLEHVSQILSDHGFSPTGEGIRIEDLCPYKWWPMTDGEAPKTHGVAVGAEAAAETPHRYPADKKAATSKLGRRWQHESTWYNFFPFWRSMLAHRHPVKLNPVYAQDGVLHLPDCEPIHNNGSKLLGELSMPAMSNVRLMARRIPQVSSMNRPRRLFGTVALKILKVLKNA